MKEKISGNVVEVRKKSNKVMAIVYIIRRNIWKSNENRTIRFEKRVKELVSTDAYDLWKTFKGGVPKPCNDVCEKKKSRRDRGDIWWWNKEVKGTIMRKNGITELRKFPPEENKIQYKGLTNQTRKIVARSMIMEVNQE